MNKHVILLATLCSLLWSVSSFAQRSSNSTFDYYSPGWWTFGITGGASWQGSDVCAIPGWGVGVDLAKNVYHRPYGLLDFDLRGRALYTQSYGADHFRTYGINNNPAVNGTNGNADYTAPEGPGFTFMNHRTEIGELSLEGVLTANRLRENTGIILQGFGGIGLNGYEVRTDQLSYNNELHDVSSIDIDRRRLDVLSQIGTYGDYETLAEDYENTIRVSAMPSLGLGVGYQLTPWLSAGVEHKTTWAMHDNLDGQRFNVENDNLSEDKDRYNHTSLYLRFRLGKRNYDAIGEEPETPRTPECPMPIISFSTPKKAVSTTKTRNYNISATVENIESRNNIEMTLNGKAYNKFSYSEKRDRLSALLNLHEGDNEITITVTNDCGKTDFISRVITLEEDVVRGIDVGPTPEPRPQKNYPTVRITRPSADPYRSDESVVRLTAEIEHVSGRDDIIFKINRRTTDNFNFGYFDDKITADIPLDTENTIVSIEVRNQHGSDTDTRKLINNALCHYTGNDDRNNEPSVRITRPSADPYTTSENSVSLRATIKNVDSKRDITYTLNGERSSNFEYDSYSDKFTSTVPLNTERVEVKITAENHYGKDSDNTTIRTSASCEPEYVSRPTVQINKPMSNPYNTDRSSQRVVATIKNVTEKESIHVKVNNKRIYNFSFIDSKDEVSFTANLDAGKNTVIIEASNSAGRDSDDTVINYNAVEKPRVTITTPKSDPYSTKSNTANIIATIRNIDSKSNITFKVNGKKRPFDYNTYKGKLTADIDLQSGNNTVVIKAVNSAGSDSDDTVIEYKKGRGVVTGDNIVTEIFAPKPTVKITKPTTSSFHKSSDEKVTVIATITNVKSKEDITFTIDGKVKTNFKYMSRHKRFTADIVLNEGENKIKITGRNGKKKASDDITITYKKRGSSSGQFGDTYSDGTGDDNDNDDENDGGGKADGGDNTPTVRGSILGRRSRNSNGKKPN